MRIQCSILIAIVVMAAGCNVQTGVSPTETIIANSSVRDFGFVGTWIPMPNEDIPNNVATYEIVIDRDGEYTASINDQSRNSSEKICVNFRTHEISKDQPRAIVEIELGSEGKTAYRRVAIGEVMDDHLYLWMIDGRKIGEHLYKDGVTAVIEHFSFSTSIRCDPEKLLESLSKHSRDIVGTAQVFRRKRDDGG